MMRAAPAECIQASIESADIRIVAVRATDWDREVRRFDGINGRITDRCW